MVDKVQPGKAILKLAELVNKEQGIRVVFGRTNGRDSIHISKSEHKIPKKGQLPPGLSYTMYSAAEWTYHQWNSSARKERKSVNKDVIDAIRNREAI